MCKKRNNIIKTFFVVIMLVFMFRFFIDFRSESEQPTLTRATVIRVVDGDTFILKIDGTDGDYDAVSNKYGTKVRLIGVDAPESVAPESYAENTDEGRMVSDIVKDKVKEGDTVYVEYDIERYDRYGRTLVYMYFADGSMVQEWMIENGYAKVAEYPPNVRYNNRFRQLARNGI